MNEQEFELKKIKIDSSGKVNVVYNKIIKDGDAVYSDEVEVTSPRLPHPDLEKSLKSLVPLLVDANDLRIYRNDIKIMPKLKAVIDTKEGQRLMEVWDNALNDSVTVTGVSIQGDIENGSCVITGKRKIKHTGGAMNSPKISFNGDSFGFEAEVCNLVQVIIDETFSYIFENKSSTPELFGEEEVAA